MALKLEKPLVVFDLETTGINVSKDRIVEISLLKVFPDGNEVLKTYRVNPGIPIPNETSEIHGIYDADVADKPAFKELAPELIPFLKECDFCGFNSNKFDFPLLVEEFFRAGFEFDISKRKFIDVQRIFHHKEPRNLKAALKFYCDQDLENAHSAEADTMATWAILKAQLEKYDDLPSDINGLHNMSGQNNLADLAGRLVFKGDIVVFNFGKYRGQSVVNVLKKDAGYYKWMMDGDFPIQTKNILTKLFLSTKNGS